MRPKAEAIFAWHLGPIPHFLKLPVSPSGVADGIPGETAVAASANR